MLSDTFTPEASLIDEVSFNRLYSGSIGGAGTFFQEVSVPTNLAKTLLVNHDVQGKGEKATYRHVIQVKVPVLDTNSFPTGKFATANVTFTSPAISQSGDEVMNAIKVLMAFCVKLSGGVTVLSEELVLVSLGSY